MKKNNQHLGIFIRGFCMGAADLIPGVSGGTIAFICGIYSRLLTAIAVFSTVAFWQAVLRLQIKKVFALTDWQFLSVLFLGLLTAVFTLSKLLHYLLAEQSQYLLGFFCGLVLASAVFLWRQIAHHSPLSIAAAVLAAAVTFAIVSLAGMQLNPTPLTLFLCGMVAICAMILPGISGSYILLILGVYPAVIAAIHNREFATLFIFAMGCGLGLLLFSRVLLALLKRHGNMTMAVLIGIMVGAAPKLWPWKKITDDQRLILADNVLPTAASGGEIIGVLLLFIIGFASVLLISYRAKKVDASL